MRGIADRVHDELVDTEYQALSVIFVWPQRLRASRPTSFEINVDNQVPPTWLPLLRRRGRILRSANCSNAPGNLPLSISRRAMRRQVFGIQRQIHGPCQTCLRTLLHADVGSPCCWPVPESRNCARISGSSTLMVRRRPLGHAQNVFIRLLWVRRQIRSRQLHVGQPRAAREDAIPDSLRPRSRDSVPLPKRTILAMKQAVGWGVMRHRRNGTHDPATPRQHAPATAAASY